MSTQTVTEGDMTLPAFPSGGAPRLPIYWQLGKSLNTCMEEILNTKLWTDVVFRCKDHDVNNTDDRIAAHKVILAARSPVFEAMFYGPCADATNAIELVDIKADVFKLFLSYIYSDETTLTEEATPFVLEIAHKYQVPSLVKYCADFLSSILTATNACAILEMALFYDEKHLIKTSSDFIDDNAGAVLESDGFLEMSENCLAYILKGNTFFADETDIFQTAVSWSTKKCEKNKTPVNGRNIRSTLGKAFYHLRIPTMSVSEFSGCCRKKGFFSLDEYEDIIGYIEDRIPDLVSTNSTSERRKNVCTTLLDATSIANTGYEGYADTVESSLKLYITDDIVLQRIDLATINTYERIDHPYCYEQTKSDRPSMSMLGGGQYQKKNPEYVMFEFCGALKGTLDIQNVGSFSCSVPLNKGSRVIVLKNPIQLKKSKEPYLMTFHLENSVSKYVNMKLKILKTTRELKLTTESKHVEFQYLPNTHMAIHSITFMNFSERDDHEAAVDNDDVVECSVEDKSGVEARSEGEVRDDVVKRDAEDY